MRTTGTPLHAAQLFPALVFCMATAVFSPPPGAGNSSQTIQKVVQVLKFRVLVERGQCLVDVGKPLFDLFLLVGKIFAYRHPTWRVASQLFRPNSPQAT
jgi:hypothetical protein